MEIGVEPDQWGESQPRDIEVLLRDVAFHLTLYLRDSIEGTIIVKPTASTKDMPRTLYRSTPEGPFTILLQARDMFWSKYSYQFAHELCHVLSNYERLRDNPNNWFHETICELASVFTLRRMAEKWTTSPPYPKWADYAESLASYANEMLSREECHLPSGMTLARWLLLEEESLRRDTAAALASNTRISDELRHKYAIVAYALLQVFESEPTGWNTIRRLPNSSALFKDYLSDWHSQVEPIDKPFVNCIIQLFEE